MLTYCREFGIEFETDKLGRQARKELQAAYLCHLPLLCGSIARYRITGPSSSWSW
jgi:hypothetical protein